MGETPFAKIVTTVYYALPPEAKEYYEESRGLHVLVFGGGRRKLEELNDRWMEENCVADDDYEDNISAMNPFVNEMTTIYAAYRHPELTGGAEYVGHNHYRRFWTDSDVDGVSAYDGMVSLPIPLFTARIGTTIGEQYGLCHYSEDLDVMREMVIERGMCRKSELDGWASLRSLFAPCNCFLLRMDLFRKYCSEVFPMVTEFPSRIDVTGRDDYQKRACSFLSERLTSLWFYARGLAGMRWKETPLTERLNWKPKSSGDSRGYRNGVFVGDQSVPKIAEWVRRELKLCSV